MIKHVWSVLANAVTEDKETNNISFTALEQLQVVIGGGRPEIPVVPIDFEIVGLWTKESLDEKINGVTFIEAFSPKGVSLYEEKNPQVNIDLENYARHRTRAKFHGLPLDESGTYIFKIYLEQKDVKRKKVAEIPLQIDITYE